MKNKATTTYKWAYLPFVFSSAAILATSVNAVPNASQQYQDARQTSQANYEYVGGKTQVGVGVTDDGDATLDINQVISEGKNSSTSVGLWGEYDLKGDDKGFGGRGAQINHNWVSRDGAGRATHVNKVFGAYDRNRDGHDKATIGYGQENENLFWEGHVSKGLSDKIDSGSRTANGKTVYNQAYDYGVGGSVGTFLPDSNVRVRAGLDHEWGEDYEGESRAKNTTLSAGIEKFIQGTPHSLGLDVAASKRSGGYEGNNDNDDVDVSGKLSYRYDFGGASIYQPDKRYRRVRVEVPGQAVAPRYAKKAQFKRVETYKSVPVFGNKTVRTPYKQLVKSTMELEGQTFFKLNSARIIPSAQTRLKQIASQIRKNGYKGSIRITGNTCGLGNAKYDQILSEKRANAVKQFLISNGFDANRLVARGLGKGSPKYPNTPDQGFKNRRVDIEYVSEQKAYKTAYKTEQKRVQTGTRKVSTGFKNVPAGFKNVMIDSGRAGAPRVIWKTEAIATSPAWVTRALHNNIKHNTNVNTYQTLAEGSTSSQNLAPTAVNDSSTIQCNNGPVTINVLGNDSDPENDNLTITNVTNGQFGTTEVVNGQVVYTPNPGTTGCGQTDNFQYTVSDGNGNTSTASVNVIINEDNKAPTAVNDSVTTEQGQVVALNTLANDSDPEGDTLTIISVQNPANGSAEIVGGQIVYTPNADFVGTETFTYTISDGRGNTSTATETVVVTASAVMNVAPVAQNDSATTNPGQAVTLATLANDSDADGDTLTITDIQAPANGSAVVSADGQGIVYTPNPGFTGTDRFTYTISDGQGNSAMATETVVVTAPVDSNVNASDDLSSTNEGTPVVINVLNNDDTDASITRIVTNPSNGLAEIIGDQIVYTPNAGFSGTDTFSYEVRDPAGNLDVASVTVTVNDVNKVPVAVNDSATTDENTAVTLNTAANDTDPDGDNLMVTNVQQPANGSAVISADGKTIVYTPNAGFFGTESFTYTISDGNGGTAQATETVTVREVNDKPNAVNDSATTDENTAVTLNTAANDTDPNGDNLTVINVQQPANGSAVISADGKTIVYTPNAGFFGTESFQYTISDGNGGTDTATETVTVREVNDKPNAVNDSATTDENTAVTLNTVANDTDPNGDNLRVINVQQPANGSAVISADGKTIVYTPNAGFFGTESFQYTISDGNGGTDTATETVTVLAGNRAPIAKDDSESTSCSAITINVLGNDSDPDRDALSIVNVGGASLGSAVVSGGKIIYTPTPTACAKGHTGLDTFSYTISDNNGGTDTATVTVDVQGATNSGGTRAEPDDVSTLVNQAIRINVLSNDAGNGLTISHVDTPKHGKAEIVGSTIKYTPAPGFTGTDSFWYDILDENGYPDSALILVYVEESWSK